MTPAGRAVASRWIDWAVAERALGGADVSGDRHAVHETERGAVIAVVDGLGHGEEAAAAAEIAIAELDRHVGEPVEEIIRASHVALRGSRGVAMSVASIDVLTNSLTWIGVGNVDGVLLHLEPAFVQTRRRRAGPVPQRLLLRGGVVGYQLPLLRSSTLSVSPGDVLALATDGVHSSFAETIALGVPPGLNVEAILSRHGKATDDALVLAARYLGGPA